MAAILHLELVEQTATALQLRFWETNPNEVRTRTLALPEIDDLIRVAEADYYSPLPARLQDIGRCLFGWLDGGERWLTEAILAEANHAPVLVLAIAMPHRLAHLPWEALHDGATFLLHALNPPVLPVRWRNAKANGHAAANRPLQTLFMASSPENVEPVLDFEREEAAILDATARHPLDLMVEESGCLEELGALMRDYGPDYFDVLHLTGHAGHGKDNRPVFLLEDGEGGRKDATALDLAGQLPSRPPLVFLSGCRTTQNAGHGEVRSLAEQLIEAGFRNVLGWGRPVRDTDATLAARHLYQELAAGEPLPLALIRTHAKLREAGARDWHLLRLFCAGDPPNAFVTPVKTPGRKRPETRPAEAEFLDPLTKNVKVATRSGFVGRRRMLRQSLRLLRQPEAQPASLLLHGQGGRGKSSVAARLCDRLRRDFQRVVVIGRLDETSLINAWAAELPDDAHRQALRDPNADLRFRFEAALKGLAETGRPAPLFVLDDFEQNQPGASHGDLQLAPHTAAVLLPLFEALGHTGLGRVLITCRYTLPAPFAGCLRAKDVPPLDANERKKQSLRLDQTADRKTERKEADAALLAQAQAVADGNPRLFEWLHKVLEQPGLDHAGILTAMRQAEEGFRENILARQLIASLPEENRALLGRMLLLNLPVPFAAVRTLDIAFSETTLRLVLERASDLSLVDITEEDGQPHYRVPHQLGGDESSLLPLPDIAERAVLIGKLLDVLYRLWWTEAKGRSEGRTLEQIRLAVEGGRKEELVLLAKAVTAGWLSQGRYCETHSLLESIIESAARHYALLLNLARAIGSLGHGDEAGKLFREATNACPPDAQEDRFSILLYSADWLKVRGHVDEALHIYRFDLIPLSEHLGNSRLRAITLGRIADVLVTLGQMDEALRIRREEELPVYEHLGDVRARVVTLGRVADELERRGDLEEALRIRREEQLPVYESLGDMCSFALTRGKIADVLVKRGDPEEALRIYREEVIPIFERLGDVRSKVVNLCKIADVLLERGELNEALHIRRQEVLPVYEQLGDVRGLIIGRVNVAILLLQRGRKEDFPEARNFLFWAYQAATERGYKEAKQIADILRQIGLQPPEPGKSQ